MPVLALSKQQYRAFSLLLASGVGTAITASAVASESHIQLTYRYTIERIEPLPRPSIAGRRNLYIVVAPDGHVRVTERRDSGSARRRRLVVSRTIDRSQYAATAQRSGGRWTASGDGGVQGSIVWGNALIAIRSRPTGANSCAASVELQRPGGSPTFRLPMTSQPGTIGTYRNFRLTSASCMQSTQ